MKIKEAIKIANEFIIPFIINKQREMGKKTMTDALNTLIKYAETMSRDSMARRIEAQQEQIDKYHQALEKIYQELGKPRMSYNSKIERVELRSIVENCSDIAKQALTKEVSE